ncbi:MAG TPA: hypothetical protein VFI95_16250 [Terriglobales bacterium]|nr:hypothetical protein [Terriglobales bacterium]
MATIKTTKRWHKKSTGLSAAERNTNLRANAVKNGWGWLIQQRNPSLTTKWMARQLLRRLLLMDARKGRH